MKIILVSFFLGLTFSLWAQEKNNSDNMHSEHENAMQEVQGNVYFTYDQEKTPLPNIKVYWKEMPSMETYTDAEGHFVLMYHSGLYNLVAEKEGFKTQEVPFNNEDHIDINLKFPKQNDELDAVVVRSKINSLTLNRDMATMSYQISDKEILKAACCNLSESFETNPSVDVSYSDAVTGTKEIMLLGLNQKYTAYSKENINDLRGLATYDGLEFIPGRWIQSMQLTKGSSSVTTGYEGITGMINTNFYQFKDEPKTSINFYINQNARVEGNVVSIQKLSDKWSNVTLLHGSSRFQKIDQNKDGFLDTPLSTQLNLANVMRYNDLEGKGWNSFIGFQLLQSDKMGGQKEYQSQRDRLSTNYYGVENNTKRFSLWNKVGKLLNQKGESVGFLQQFTYHNQEQTFGVIPYNGKEISYQAKLMYDNIIGNTNHKITAGSEFLYDGFKENYYYTKYDRNERNLGLFAEYQYTYLEKLKLLLDARVDFHNLAGTQFSPKVFMKYSPVKRTDIRLSAGRSFRTANVWEENQRYRVSNRKFQIISSPNGKIYGLDPETAWNYGISLNQEFKLFHQKSNITVDFFRTDFQNQVVADLDESPQNLLLYNIKNGSSYNSFQTLFTTTVFKKVELRMAYKYYDTKVDFAAQKRSAPFIAKHRGFFNVAYETSNKPKKWSFDTTLQWVGKMRLPDTKSNPVDFQRPDYSKSFVTLNAQVARDFSSHFRIYLGAENLTNYTQKNPIIQVENPFGDYFDASMVYAPIMHTNFYFGLDINF